MTTILSLPNSPTSQFFPFFVPEIGYSRILRELLWR
jgi:hypothetical protein